MARKARHQPLNVFLNARTVGKLRRETSGAIEFQYEQSWLDWEFALPVSLSLPLQERRHAGAPVVAVFDNLLPDSDTLRRRVAQRVHAQGTDAYSMLAALGRDCVGALQFLPEGHAPGPAGEVSGKPVSDEEIAALLGDLAAAPLGVGEDEDFRISIAGAQEKTALLFWNGKWHKPTGTSATTHILKPQIGRLPNGIDLSFSVENEFFCLTFLNALGILSANVAIENFGHERVLVVERFDRRWTRDHRLLRLPQEDFCQALSVPPSLKYEADGGPGVESILNLLKGSDDPDRDQRMFLRAIVAFWLIGATDGHAKNFSIFLSPGGRYRLTPLYDVLSAQPSLGEGQIRRNRMKLAMAIGTNRHYVVDTVMPRHFVQSAGRAGVGKSVVDQTMASLFEDAPRALDTLLPGLPPGFPAEVADSIASGFKARLRHLQAADAQS
jgi:serine/threonine-protein kinase HipA